MIIHAINLFNHRVDFVQNNLSGMAVTLDRWKGQRDNISLLLGVRQWSTCWKALADIPAPGKARWSNIPLQALLFNHQEIDLLSNTHLRSERRVSYTIPAACYPHFAPNNRGRGKAQWPWEGGEGSPGLCSREECDHRRHHRIITGPTRNDERLNMFKTVIGISHLRWRKSSAGVVPSVFWQLGKFFDKATFSVPAVIFS